MILKSFNRSRVQTSKIQTLQSCPWKNIRLPAEVAASPTMLLTYELLVLHWLSIHHVNGKGRIVDGGCFLGGSTGALASGLAMRGDRDFEKTIASYDLFRIEPYTLNDYRNNFANPVVDASFRPDFERNIAPWAKHVDVMEGDAATIGWSGEPIEVLFLDLVKTWRLNDLVMDQFLPHLIPGHSVIIQQDYMWGFGPWIHITMELLAPYVTILDSMLCSVVYLLTKPLPPKLFGASIRGDLSAKTKLRLMDRAVKRWSGQQRGLVELARVMLICEIESASAAKLELSRILASYPDDYAVQACGQRIASDLTNEPWWIN